MQIPTFRHYDLKQLEPSFGSPVVDLILDLDYLRRKELRGTTSLPLFQHLKRLFHTLESVGSARIEGNNTTVAEYLESRIEESCAESAEIREIRNVESTLEWIEECAEAGLAIDHAFVAELHRRVVEALPSPPNGEGDPHPGEYRQVGVVIGSASHKPPPPDEVRWYMDELINFVNRETSPKYDLLRVAVAHHRFVWVHPFLNGNGRVVRLFTYALLVKAGFKVHIGRIINPTAVFCDNRTEYYRHLALADTGTDEGILSWCDYALSGLKREVEKVDRLLDFEYLKREIVLPMILSCSRQKLISDQVARVLMRGIEQETFKAGDLKTVLKRETPSEISRIIADLKEQNLVVSTEEGGRHYRVNFDNPILRRGLMRQLGEAGFLPVNL